MSITDEQSKRRTPAASKLQSLPRNGVLAGSHRKNTNGEGVLSKSLAEIPHYMRPSTGSCHDACKRDLRAASDFPKRAPQGTINRGSSQIVCKYGVKSKGSGAKSPAVTRSCPPKIATSFGTSKAIPSANSRNARCEACKQRKSVEATGSRRTPPHRSVALCAEPSEDDAICEDKFGDENSYLAERGELGLPIPLVLEEIGSDPVEKRRDFRRGNRRFGDENRIAESIVLKHRGTAGRKASEEWMVDHVVESAVNELSHCEESKTWPSCCPLLGLFIEDRRSCFHIYFLSCFRLERSL